MGDKILRMFQEWVEDGTTTIFNILSELSLVMKALMVLRQIFMASLSSLAEFYWL